MKIKAVARQAEFNSDKSLFLSNEITKTHPLQTLL
jgi:hypothetical protein